MEDRGRSWPVAFMVFAGLLMIPGAATAGGVGDVNFFLGLKQLDSNDWAPTEDQGEFGAEMTWSGKSWPVSIATDVLFSADEETNVFNDTFFGNVELTLRGQTWEVDLGVRKIWGKKTVRPYLGGGLALVGARVEAEAFGITQSVTGSSAGAWAGGGVFFRLGSRFNIGFSARWSDGNVDLSGVDVAAGGVHYGLLLGWGWPGKN